MMKRDWRWMSNIKRGWLWMLIAWLLWFLASVAEIALKGGCNGN